MFGSEYMYSIADIHKNIIFFSLLHDRLCCFELQILWQMQYILYWHRVIYGVESWNGVVEWSGVWSEVESTLYSCNLGRAFVVELRYESTLKTQPR